MQIQMVYCFDTSAINELQDDPDREAIIARLLNTSTVRITAINVMEVCKNSNLERLRLLMTLVNRLSVGTLPLEAPNALLVQLAKTHQAGIHDVTVTIGEERHGLWDVMQNPSSLDETRRQEVFRWTGDVETGFHRMHADARPALEAMHTGDSWPRSGAEVIRTHTSISDRLFYETITLGYKSATGCDLNKNDICGFLDTNPSWAVWWAAWVHSIWRRAMQSTRYGKKWNPGGVDIWSVVYLPLCDAFVTHDVNQRRAFRIANTFNNPLTKSRIVSYGTFRERFVTAA